VSAFDSVGRHIETFPLPQTAGLVTRPAPLRGGAWIAQLPPMMRSQDLPSILRGQARSVGTGIARIIRFDEARVDTLAVYEPSDALWWYDAEDGLPFSGARTGFGPGFIWSVAGDSVVAVIDATRGAVQWYRAQSGRLTPAGSRDLNLAVQRVTEADLEPIKRQVESEHRDVRRMGYLAPATKSHFASAILDDRGNVWIRRLGPGIESADQATQVLVLGFSGQQDFEVTVPSGLTLGSVRGDLLAGTIRDDLDVQYVQVYRIR
jgi:hypothetical protein